MRDFQLVIPMSGTGQRFREAGYLELKPFIQVDGKPIVEHILDMYPLNSDILIILSNEDEELVEHIELLKNLRENVKIVTIPAHKKGPGYAIWKASNFISSNKPVIVNYADFSGDWNFEEFLEKLDTNDGNILTYTGFHPHMTRSQKFAYVRLNEKNLVIDIQEKAPFTSSPMEEHASAGTYGFKNGTILLEAIRQQIDNEYSLNGEYYLSLTYKSLLDNSMSIAVTDMSRFNQWGTPEDLQDWLYWKNAVRKTNASTQESFQEKAGNLVLLAAGKGSRVAEIAKTEKPFIKIGTKFLWQRAIYDGAMYDEKILVTRSSLVAGFVKGEFKSIVDVDNQTSGQAASALFGLKEIENLQDPVSIYSCDNILNGNSVPYFQNELSRLSVLVARNYPPACMTPEEYSWVTIDDQRMVSEVYFKKSPPDVNTAYLITGNFHFRSTIDAIELCEEVVLGDIRVNNEHYLDSIIELELNKGNLISIIEIPDFIAIGTRNEYETYFYNAN